MSLILLAFCGLWGITAPIHFSHPQKSAVFTPQNCPHCGQKWSARRKKAPGFSPAFSPRRPKSLDFDRFQRFPAFAASGRSRPFRRISFFDRTRCAGLWSIFLFSRTAAQRPVLGFRWVRARLCPENRTQPRHAAHAGGQVASCCACWNASKRFRMRSCSHFASSFASFCS